MKPLALLLALLIATPVAAQTYEEILKAHPEAKEMAPTEPGVPVYERPSSISREVMRLMPGDVLLAVENVGSFWHVATLEKGYVGYVYTPYLKAYDPMAGRQSSQPEQHPTDETTEPAVQPMNSGSPADHGGYARKDPGVGMLLGLLWTGGGHLYAGEVDKALGLMFVSGASVGIGYYITADTIDEQECKMSATRVVCEDNTNWAPLIAGIGVAAFAHVYSILDGGKAAVRANARHGYTANVKVQPALFAHKRVGLSLSARW